MTLAGFLGFGLALYVATGVCAAAAFVTAGVGQVLATPASFSLGARLVLLPGTAALWPYVIARWLKARSRR